MNATKLLSPRSDLLSFQEDVSTEIGLVLFLLVKSGCPIKFQYKVLRFSCSAFFSNPSAFTQ